MSHQEKQEIFERYAESVGYSSWSRLFNSYIQNSHYLQLHIFAACDLVQEEQQKRIAEKEETISGDDFYFTGVPVEEIINPENLIK